MAALSGEGAIRMVEVEEKGGSRLQVPLSRRCARESRLLATELALVATGHKWLD